MKNFKIRPCFCKWTTKKENKNTGITKIAPRMWVKVPEKKYVEVSPRIYVKK